MGNAARERILTASWDAAFDVTYGAYRHCHKNWQTTHPAAPIQSPNARDFEAVA
jgi:hypothetical protein